MTTSGGGIGGTERVAVSLARQFTARGWEVRNVFPDTPESSAVVPWAREQGAIAEVSASLRAIQHVRSLRDVLALHRLVRTSKPHVVNLHYGVSHIAFKDILAVRFAGGHRCVVAIHGCMPLTGWRRRLMMRLATGLSHTVIANSSATRQMLLDAGMPPRKVRTIHPGIPVPKHSPSRQEARTLLGLAASDFVVSSVARLVPEKGISDLVEACANVRDRGASLRLIVAGDGPEHKSLEELARLRLGDRAHFFGAMSDPSMIYAAADLFVLPSFASWAWMESYGMVYIEAAMHGIPSIGTKVGGVPDAIIDGETGLLVPPRDVTALATAIERLYSDAELRLRLGETAHDRARRGLTEEHMSEAYARVFLGKG